MKFTTFTPRYLLLSTIWFYICYDQKVKNYNLVTSHLSHYLSSNSKSQIQVPTEVEQVYICVSMIKRFSNSQAIKCYHKAKGPETWTPLCV